MKKQKKGKRHRILSWLHRNKNREPNIESVQEAVYMQPEFFPCDAEGETTVLSRNCRSNSEGETTILSTNCQNYVEVQKEMEQEGETTILSRTDEVPLQEENPEMEEPPKQMPMNGQQYDDIGATQLLSQPENASIAVYGCVVRAKTGDVINITSKIFRFGVNGETSEYQVSNNPSISRNHATLFVEDRHFFIMDGGSTNGTFLEGTRLQPFRKTEIISGSLFSIADEVFQFFAGKE